MKKIFNIILYKLIKFERTKLGNKDRVFDFAMLHFINWIYFTCCVSDNHRNNNCPFNTF